MLAPELLSQPQAYIESSPDEAPERLRERFQEQGYLLLKRAVAATDCQALLEQIVAELHPHVQFAPGTTRPVLCGEPFFESDAVWDELYPRVQALEGFHWFFHSPRLLELMSLVVGEDVFVYPMKMARIATPRKIGFETPPHQDAYSHHAGPTMAGIWVALHDVDDSMGRVTVLAGSHKGGVRRVFEAEGVGGIQCEVGDDETGWHVSDFEQGDVLIFHSATVHKAEPNTAVDRARISVDTRFCDYGAPVFSTNLDPHHGWRIPGLDWDAIYRGWHHPELQYYWRDYPNLF